MIKELYQRYRKWRFHRNGHGGYPLVVARYTVSLLHPDFVQNLKLIRSPDDVMTITLKEMPGFRLNDAVQRWLASRDCVYDLQLSLKPQLSEAKNDHLTFTFFEEYDRMEFKLTFL